MRVRAVAAAVAAVALAALAAPAAGTQPPVGSPVFAVESTLAPVRLAERDADARRSIASITKLMTVLVALDRARPGDPVVVPAAAAGIGESTVGLRPGQRVTVLDLVRAALVPSANDAATALALHVAGSVPAFAKLMNAKARRLGMRDSRFRNPHGLDEPGHYSTARDVVRLARAAFRNAVVRRAARLRSVTIGGRTYESTDRLAARLPQLIGTKTGQTTLAMWSQVAAARGRGVTVYAAVLGGVSREQRTDDLEALLRWALAEYVTITAVSGTRVYAAAGTAYGRPPVPLVAPSAIARTVRAGRPLLERVVAPTHVALPVREGQRLGSVEVFDGERLVASSPLVAGRSVAAPGTAGKIRWYAGRTVHHLAGLLP